MSNEAITHQIRVLLLKMARERGSKKTFCPSEVARALTEDWRDLMPAVRAEAARLVAANQLRCRQRGHDVDPEHAHGPIRLSLRVVSA